MKRWAQILPLCAIVHTFPAVDVEHASTAGTAAAAAQAAEALNAAYAGFDPLDASSPLGVFVHVTGSHCEASSSAPYLTKCSQTDCLNPQNYVSECRVSTVLLNRANGNMGRDWAYQKSMCHVLPQFCNVTVGIWPGADGKFYQTPGMLYYGDVPRNASKCAYAFDGSSDMRPNRGCGCSINKPNCAPNTLGWPCPDGRSACADRDPLNKLRKITGDSAVIRACQCAAMNVTEDANPTWAGASVATVSCLWRGPSFFPGQGEDELRRALRQQHKFVRNASMPWNEVVLDGVVMNDAIAADPAGAIAAFFFPLTPECAAASSSCSDKAYAIRDQYQKQYGVVVPVIGLDVTNGTTPFQAVPQQLPARAVESESASS